MAHVPKTGLSSHNLELTIVYRNFELNIFRQGLQKTEIQWNCRLRLSASMAKGDKKMWGFEGIGGWRTIFCVRSLLVSSLRGFRLPVLTGLCCRSTASCSHVPSSACSPVCSLSREDEHRTTLSYLNRGQLTCLINISELCNSTYFTWFPGTLTVAPLCSPPNTDLLGHIEERENVFIKRMQMQPWHSGSPVATP